MVTNGVFNVTLTGIPNTVFQGGVNRYLFVTVESTLLTAAGGGGEKLAATPYALSVAAGAVTDTEVSASANIDPAKIKGGTFQNSVYYYQNSLGVSTNTVTTGGRTYSLNVGGDLNIGGDLYQKGALAIFSNWTKVGPSNEYIARGSSVTINSTNIPLHALDVYGSINIVGVGAALLLNGGTPTYSNWTNKASPSNDIYRPLGFVGIGMPATVPLTSTFTVNGQIAVSQGGNPTANIMVGYTNAAPGPAGYYAVYAP